MMSPGIRSGVNWIAAERERQPARERAREQRLGGARHALEQHVALAQQRDQQQVDRVVLTDHDPVDLLAQAVAQPHVRSSVPCVISMRQRNT